MDDTPSLILTDVFFNETTPSLFLEQSFNFKIWASIMSQSPFLPTNQREEKRFQIS
jgi:hypothetical protein